MSPLAFNFLTEHGTFDCARDVLFFWNVPSRVFMVCRTNLTYVNWMKKWTQLSGVFCKIYCKGNFDELLR